VELDLQISSDAKSLEGTWKNSLGRKGPVKFVKVAAEAAPKSFNRYFHNLLTRLER
jgi:hypothetical protein